MAAGDNSAFPAHTVWSYLRRAPLPFRCQHFVITHSRIIRPVAGHRPVDDRGFQTRENASADWALSGVSKNARHSRRARISRNRGLSIVPRYPGDTLDSGAMGYPQTAPLLRCTLRSDLYFHSRDGMALRN